MTVKQAIGLVVCLVAAAPCRGEAQQIWLPAACELKPGHYLVNSGLLYLKSAASTKFAERSEEHTSELQSRLHLVCRLLLEKKKKKIQNASRKQLVYHDCIEKNTQSHLVYTKVQQHSITTR